jgi:hypothetical protein
VVFRARRFVVRAARRAPLDLYLPHCVSFLPCWLRWSAVVSLESRGTSPSGRAWLRDRPRLAAMQVRGRHQIPVIRASLTVETLVWHREGCGPSHDRGPEWITTRAAVTCSPSRSTLLRITSSSADLTGAAKLVVQCHVVLLDHAIDGLLPGR